MLDLNKLNKVKEGTTKTVAQCPACAESGMDKGGRHLVLYPGGKFGCVAHPGDHEHTRRIWHLAGDKNALPVRQWHGLIEFSAPKTTPAARQITRLSRKAVVQDRHITDGSDGSFSLVMESSNKSYVVTGSCGDSAQHWRGYRKQPSEPSEPQTKAPTTEPTGKQPSEPSELEPDRFIDVLATWSCILADPAWKDRPEIVAYLNRPKLVGWRRTGAPIYARPQAGAAAA